LCRDVCHYCTFAKAPRGVASPYLPIDEVLAIAQAGVKAGCKEALFTLGDKPELRYAAARNWLDAAGFESTVDYVRHACQVVLDETGLLPHVNAGVLDATQLEMLRPVMASFGLMLESTADALQQRGQPHHGSPDKEPRVRLQCLEDAGLARVPTTTGLLIGIGESRADRLAALLAIDELQGRHGHVQEVIIQGFVPKQGTRMAQAPAASFDELRWTIAVARIVLGARMSIQTPPNLAGGSLADLIAAGSNDWGGVSPVTIDHVNPEKPWPAIERLERETLAAGKVLVERLCIYPDYLRDLDLWADTAMRRPILVAADASGLARDDQWVPGVTPEPPRAVTVHSRNARSTALDAILQRPLAGDELTAAHITQLFAARGAEVDAVCAAADALRRDVCGDTVRYVVNRNINYTNVCTKHCTFCAFARTRRRATGDPAYLLDLDEVSRRCAEAWDRGATEVCMQGGIHPSFDGHTYLEICRAAKRGAPNIHVHAFSPLEVHHGATTLGLPVARYLSMLREAGLGTLPGTAAEILDDEVRRRICPDKLMTGQWLDVMSEAHRVGLRSTSTMMFGHVDEPVHWARHLLRLRDLQVQTGGFTEFVPLPFVPLDAPMYRRGESRRGPTFREALLVHAVARLVLHPVLTNVQVSWTKLGPLGAVTGLQAGANDLGGTLMNESISRAAGAAHGQECPPARMDELIRSIGRQPAQRTTLYGAVSDQRRRLSYDAAPLGACMTSPAPQRWAAPHIAHEHRETA
jgi:FO synthase